MGYKMNPFRVAGDISHATSKAIIITAILRNRSAEGVSLLTQLLYALVFISRYLDLFFTNPFHNFLSFWNTTLKITYIVTSIFIVFLMTRVYARTRETERGWRLSAYSLGGSLIVAPWIGPLLAAMFKDEHRFRWLDMIHDFSELLESTCILPQLLLLRQTTVPTVIDSFYLFALFMYRILYVLNWIWREADPGQTHKPDRVDVLAGIVQVILYVDFAWVYYTRQRVKLRGGGVVDSDDFRRGLFMRRLFGKPQGEEDGEDEEAAPALGGSRTYNDFQHNNGNGHSEQPAPGRNGSAATNKWGKRGISVSADDSVLAHERGRQGGIDDERDPFMDDDEGAGDAKMTNPDELAKVLDDEDSDNDEGVLPGGSTTANKAGVSGGEEWRG